MAPSNNRCGGGRRHHIPGRYGMAGRRPCHAPIVAVGSEICFRLPSSPQKGVRSSLARHPQRPWSTQYLPAIADCCSRVHQSGRRAWEEADCPALTSPALDRASNRACASLAMAVLAPPGANPISRTQIADSNSSNRNRLPRLFLL